MSAELESAELESSAMEVAELDSAELESAKVESAELESVGLESAQIDPLRSISLNSSLLNSSPLQVQQSGARRSPLAHGRKPPRAIAAPCGHRGPWQKCERLVAIAARSTPWLWIPGPMTVARSCLFGSQTTLGNRGA